MKLALCVALLGMQTFAAETIPGGPSVIPHVVDGDGWKTIFTVVNLDTSAASFTLRFYADDGTPLAFPTSSSNSPTITGTLAARGSMTIETSGTAVPLTQGWAYLDTPGTIGGTAIFRRVISGQPNYESSEALDTSLGSHYEMPFDHRSGAATGFAIVNQTAGTSGVISLVFRDEGGTPLFSDSFTLLGLRHSAFTLTQKYPQLIGLRGTFEVSTSGVYINLLALHFLNGSFTAITPLASWEWQ
ncbi:MAG: hypothetical protein M3O20_00195 [Acidobacteriota bacterium]|nr:hypothetical protein [Acidobacteriota bacterium]